MKGILIALAVSTALTGGAYAGDLNHRGSLKDPVERQGRLPEPVVDAPDYRWSGITIGGFGGYSVGTLTPDDYEFGLSAEGAFVEGQVGYRVQLDRFVLGAYGCASYGTIEYFNEAFCAMGTAGFLLTPQTLLSLEGGWRWQSVELNDDVFLSGPQVGVALEHKLNRAMSIKGAFAHHFVDSVDGDDVPDQIDLGDNRAMLGIVYQLGGF